MAPHEKPHTCTGYLGISLDGKCRYFAERKEFSPYPTSLPAMSSLIPSAHDWAELAWHMAVVCSSERDQLQRCFFLADTGSCILYPISSHLPQTFADLGGNKRPFTIEKKIHKDLKKTVDKMRWRIEAV